MKKNKAVHDLLKKYEDHELFSFDDLNFNLPEFSNFIGSDDLFAKQYVVTLNNILETDFSEEVLGKLASLRDSSNVFVIVEQEIGKPIEKILGKHVEDLRVFDLPKENNRFNIFQITDAFGARDKKNTWVLLQKALRENISAEEVLNILIWQTKNLLFVKGESDMKRTGLSPFVFNKARSYSENFKLEELQNISRILTKLFHESHLGLPLEPNLELFLLKSL